MYVLIFGLYEAGTTAKKSMQASAKRLGCKKVDDGHKYTIQVQVCHSVWQKRAVASFYKVILLGISASYMALYPHLGIW